MPNILEDAATCVSKTTLASWNQGVMLGGGLIGNCLDNITCGCVGGAISCVTCGIIPNDCGELHTPSKNPPGFVVTKLELCGGLGGYIGGVSCGALGLTVGIAMAPCAAVFGVPKDCQTQNYAAPAEQKMTDGSANKQQTTSVQERPQNSFISSHSVWFFSEKKNKMPPKSAPEQHARQSTTPTMSPFVR